MKLVPIIIGHRKTCYHCGEPIRLVILPAMDAAKWQVCEDFAGTPESIELHQCPNWTWREDRERTDAVAAAAERARNGLSR